eukprot:CAMPEP_0181178046 /NCGR_PEP_ID=MMETSP1096-20121128/5507_1 /TAXON_ID=156174 ORGANISM="Chrysochromulina ericina, Strain CCMP281" /NCGR_SAMPLE_ID=MMETSP1096 /ASSEMBLY_ACC=CAM_ASM_000453 /LENGTH=48 /DNA_ID= /DNA_START= /DNA_END= /DNA_ORIENTATION=
MVAAGCTQHMMRDAQGVFVLVRRSETPGHVHVDTKRAMEPHCRTKAAK